MTVARFIIGDVFERLAELPDDSVDLVLTSPPFLALRSYLPADHPDKGKEIGSEPTPAAFLDTLLHLTAEWRRVLAPHGSICVELGDTYAGSAVGWVTDQKAKGGLDLNGGRDCKGAGWPMAKSLCGIPHLYHLSLAYGRNLLTGEVSPAGSWRVRNVVAWCRPNPPVGALGDKFRPGTSYMTVATVARDRYFDLDAVRTEHKTGDHHEKYPQSRYAGSGKQGDHARKIEGAPLNQAGSPPLDWWEIPTQPYAGSHYAAWPMALCERPVKAMCPQRVCVTCGKPSRRIVDAELEELSGTRGTKAVTLGNTRTMPRTQRRSTTTGWTDCGHDTWRNGIVLDPFAGSGTTLAVATGHGRDAIGIDLDERNADLARERVGMFLTIESTSTEGAA